MRRISRVLLARVTAHFSGDPAQTPLDAGRQPLRQPTLPATGPKLIYRGIEKR